ncbi:AAA family ATPase [Actimicrobium antarcticum]|uniref:RecF/RecN/SMC N-terminal domain-containing protein n=1 Tax=Actimicrobium antarcticum TaxID=1051899 RepID=A0ABP7TZQ1_9BURK
MKITGIRLKNFKRFTDLAIRDIPPTAKLVLIVGPNGCGKSSLFDGLLNWYRLTAGFGYSNDDLYYRKSKDEHYAWTDTVQVTLADGAAPKKGCLYVRTAYRNDPDFSMTGITKPAAPSEELRVSRSIDNDQAVAQNYQRLVYDTMAGVYNDENDNKTVQALREELIGQLRTSMKAVFGDLVLNNIADPLGTGTFFFEKGTSKAYHFKNLSGGEKAAFDLLLDLHVKKKFFADAVYCIDELETHLHTRVQGLLLREMVNIIPDNSQLWATTHSLGVLRAAHEMATAAPGSVCIIDFDGVDPDVPREIVPSNLGRLTWEKMLSVAIDDLSSRVAPRVIVVCEGASEGANKRKNFDAEVLSKVLGAHHADVLFLSGGASSQLAASGITVRQTLSGILPTARVVSLCDLDDRSAAEVGDFEADGNLVLRRRNLESYLLDDEVIKALLEREGKAELIEAALEIKLRALQNSQDRGNPPDDLKRASGEIFVQIKALLGLRGAGNNADAFMRDTLAPLIAPGMNVYAELCASIIDRVAR